MFKLAEQSYVNPAAINALNFITSAKSPDGKPYVELVFNQWGLQFIFTTEMHDSILTNLWIDLVDELPVVEESEVVPATEWDVVNPSEEVI